MGKRGRERSKKSRGRGVERWEVGRVKYWRNIGGGVEGGSRRRRVIFLMIECGRLICKMFFLLH